MLFAFVAQIWSRSTSMTAVVILLLLPLSGCQTSGSRRGEGADVQPNSTAATPPKDARSAVTAEEQVEFVIRHGHESEPLTARDREVIDLAVGSPASGSMQEAVLALGLIKTVFYPGTGSYPTQPPGFEDKDLNPPAISGTPGTIMQPPTAVTPGNEGTSISASQATGPSLEALCRDKNLDLPKAIESNLLIKNRDVYMMTIKALEKGRNTIEFRTRVVAAIRSQADSWKELAGTVSPATTPADAAAGTPPVPAADPNAAAAPAPNHDATLAQVKVLSDQGKSYDAIQEAKKVPPNSPQYAQAQERIKQLSNSAVKDLRTKAARAFQNSLPLTEPNSKKPYLEQAKTLLEEALTKYPDADQLGTVRDNLAVISRDLGNI